MKQKIAAVLLSALTLTACSTADNQYFTKQNMGALGGAVVGGVLGSNVGGGKGQLIATGAGAILGMMVGNEIGKSLDRADKQYMSQAYQQAETAPVGQTISWNNPDSGNSGTVTPVREGTSSAGYACREFRQTVIIEGSPQVVKGTACQNADGSWQMAQ